MLYSSLGLSCDKYAEIPCHSCGHLTDGYEDFNYLGIGIHVAAVGLSHVDHLLFVVEQLVFCSLHSLLEMSDCF